jgi:hypothetical protein
MRYTQASRCGTPLLSTVFDFKVRPGTGVQPQSLNRLLATAIFLSNYTVQLQCLQRAPGRRVTEKSPFSTLNVGLAGTGNRIQATCLAGSVSRHSAIHYAYPTLSLKKIKYQFFKGPIMPVMLFVSFHVITSHCMSLHVISCY